MNRNKRPIITRLACGRSAFQLTWYLSVGRTPIDVSQARVVILRQSRLQAARLVILTGHQKAVFPYKEGHVARIICTAVGGALAHVPHHALVGERPGLDASSQRHVVQRVAHRLAVTRARARRESPGESICGKRLRVSVF